MPYICPIKQTNKKQNAMNFSPILNDAPVAAATVWNRTEDRFSQSQGGVDAYSQRIIMKDASEGRRAEFHATKNTEGRVLVTCTLYVHGGEFAHYSEQWKATKFNSWDNVEAAQKYFNAKSKQFAA